MQTRLSRQMLVVSFIDIYCHMIKMVTFVSAFILLNESRPNEKNVDTYFSQFKRLVESGVNIHLFLQSSMISKYKETIGNPSNVYIQIQEFEDLEITRNLKDAKFQLPAIRTKTKDTVNYMIIQNSKIEFVYKAVLNNVYISKKFAWIDFGIGHKIKDDSTFSRLKDIFIDSGIYFPGPYQKHNFDFNRVTWRFCGSFFFGDKESIKELYDLYQSEFTNLVRTTGILSWEVNVWAYFEKYKGWKPTWYYGDHNDSIFNIPKETEKNYTDSLEMVSPRPE